MDCISGVTSAGKITIADMLIQFGYKAPIEVARVYIDELRDEAHRLLKETNAYQGYTAIVVPVGSVMERLQFILKIITEMVPSLMVGTRLKPLSGVDRLKVDSFKVDTHVPSANVCTNGLKLYSGSYISLFYSRGANTMRQQCEPTILRSSYVLSS